jgi:hypothetical protein
VATGAWAMVPDDGTTVVGDDAVDPLDPHPAAVTARAARGTSRTRRGGTPGD